SERHGGAVEGEGPEPGRRLGGGLPAVRRRGRHRGGVRGRLGRRRRPGRRLDGGEHPPPAKRGEGRSGSHPPPAKRGEGRGGSHPPPAKRGEGRGGGPPFTPSCSPLQTWPAGSRGSAPRGRPSPASRGGQRPCAASPRA